MRQKGFTPVIVVIFLLILSVAGYFGYSSFQKAWQKGKQNVISHQSSTPEPASNCPTTIKETIAPYTNGGFKIKFGDFISKEMQQPIINAFKNRPDNIFKSSNEFVITSSRIEGDWSILSIGATDGPCYSPEGFMGSGPSCIGNIIGKRLNCQEWKMAIIGTDLHKQLISETPDTFMSRGAKQVFIEESSGRVSQ